MNTFKTLHVFDLDGTVIDSFHRVAPCLKPDGDLDLQKYRDHACSHDQIQKDTLLPLSKYMQQLIQAGELVAICTARMLSKSDYYYLRKMGMRVNTICSRDNLAKHFDHILARQIFSMKDAEYKRFYLQRLQVLYPLHELVIYDDHEGVLEEANKLGIKAFDAKQINQLIETAFRSGYESGYEDGSTEYESYLIEYESLAG